MNYKYTLLLMLFALASCQPSPSATKTKEKEEKILEGIQTEQYTVAMTDDGIEQQDLILQMMELYDADGKETMVIYYDKEGKIDYRDVYAYEGSKKIGSNYYDKDNKLLQYFTYTYNDAGKKAITSAFTPEDKLMYKSHLRYAGDGSLKRIGSVNNEGQFDWAYQYVYDKHGNEIMVESKEEKSKDRDSYIHNITKKDKENRWLERYTYKNDILSSISYRKFIYKSDKDVDPQKDSSDSKK